MDSLFKKEWDKLEDDKTRPMRHRSLIKMPFAEVKKLTYAQDPQFVKDIVSKLYAGDALILKNAYTPEFIEDLKKKAFAWGNQSPSSFHKMLEGVPDFHRVVDASIAKNYAIETIRHIYYFFPWNSDPLKLMEPIYDKWRVIKAIGGYPFDQYEKNSPKDGIVDRVIIAQYPAGTGELETHCDPYKFQRTIMGTKMSQRGVDYHKGGLYFVDRNGNEMDVEDQIEVGDMYLSYATIYHGVKMIDPGQTTDWNNPKGRWFLGLYSAVSDEVKDRHTCWSVDEEEYKKTGTDSGKKDDQYP